MCVIIERPGNHSLSPATLKSAIRQNPEGWGIMHAIDGIVKVERGMKPEDFFSAYDSIPEKQPIVLHFRIKTSGLIDINNTHPFPVLTKEQDGFDLSVVHNGFIPSKEYIEIDKSMNDTWHWVRQVARPILKRDRKLLELPQFVRMLESTVGGSRILFLDGDGSLTFLNPSSWTDYEGCRMSNTTGLGVGSYKVNQPSTSNNKRGSRRGQQAPLPDADKPWMKPLAYAGLSSDGTVYDHETNTWKVPIKSNMWPNTGTKSKELSSSSTISASAGGAIILPPKLITNQGVNVGDKRLNGSSSHLVDIPFPLPQEGAGKNSEGNSFNLETLNITKTVELITLDDLQYLSNNDLNRLQVEFPDHVIWLLMRASSYSFSEETPRVQNGKFREKKVS